MTAPTSSTPPSSASARSVVIICVGNGDHVGLEHPHPRYPVTDDLDCEEYRAAADPDAVYDQFADDPDVAAWENELAGGAS
jgi:hypothetical protein